MDASGEDAVQGATLQTFTESAEVLQLIDELPKVVCNLRKKEMAEERFTVILNRYQEQPHLLDPHLGSLVSRLLSMAREQPPSLLCQQAFRYLYLLSKVRGAKVLLRWFSHEVSDLEPVLSLLESQDASQPQTWETRYILLLWLSIIAIIPFNLCLMDGEQESQHATLNRILAVGQHYVLQTDKSRDAAPVLLSRVLSRPDVHRLKLTGFLEWCKSKLSSTKLEDREGITGACGVLATLASLFQLSKRDDIESHVPDVLKTLKASNTLTSDTTMLRKLSIKLAQRVGMVLLPARVASWRYQRGLRSLTDTLSLTQSSREQTNTVAPSTADEDDWEVREEVEGVVEVLLCGLQDWESVVRWSAAKGIGRISGRLPRSLADDILQSILALFSAREGDSAWHGGCLALAELGRRGILLPERLAEVVPAVLEALVYDEMRGTHSVGAHVRDAACYVCWSFARAYEPHQLKPHVSKLASGLLVTALFDREVNCRRAAAAAFQENVGRQGTFPHGIDILTNVDYFAVGSRTNAYLNLSAYVAQYSEYTQPLIDHVVQTKLAHWDSSLRELAAQALHSLTARLPEYMQYTVIPKLLPLVVSVDPRLRHGALHAVTQVTAALCNLKSSSVSAILGDNLVQQLVQVVPQLEAHGSFRGGAGECMRLAALSFISKMCECKLPVANRSALASWQRVIDANLPHTEELIRETAVTAFHDMSSTHYLSLSPEETGGIIQSYLSGLSSHLPFTRMGYSLALGALSGPLLSTSLASVLSGLLGVASHIQDCKPQFTESRRDAVRAISRLCRTVGVGENGLSQESVDAVFHTLVAGMNDYTTDARGDIGVVVREAAMTAATDICQLLASCGRSEMAASHIQHVISLFLQQANGKIDRTRSIAFSCLKLLLYCQPRLEGIPHHHRLASLFQERVEENINWSVAGKTFPRTVQLLALPEYTYHTLLGLVISCGGLTESTVRASRAAVLDYLREISGSVTTLEPFTDTLLGVFRRNSRVTRITQPLLVMLDLLLSHSVFDAYLSLTAHPFPRSLLALLKEEIALSTDTKKLLASVNVFCGLLQFSGVRRITLNRLMLLLCHKFPTVRRGTADQLYSTIITYDDVIPEEITEDACALLAGTKWESSLDAVREKRNLLCDLLDLQRPVVHAREGKAAKPTSSAGDTMASYRDLVDRAGY